jgi:transmembrane sensor
MNSSPSRHDPAVDEQAATWAARLDGDVLEANERAELDAWLATSPAHRAALSAYCQFSADLEEQLPALVASGAVQMPPAASAAAKPRRTWLFPAFASVALAAAAAAAVMLWPGRSTPQIENVATAVAQRTEHTLADGTRVELNAHTSLRFENTKSERRVRLSGGEALFSVAKDHTRPFLIETPNGSVRVTGTIFNVRNDAIGAVSLQVTVVEGSVEVRPIDPASAGVARPHSLGAGDQLTATAAGVEVRQLSSAVIDDVLAWREGQVVFNDVPLVEVAAHFARYHGRRINVDPAVANEKIGGRFGLDDFAAFTAGLDAALRVSVTHDPSGAVFIKPLTQ